MITIKVKDIKCFFDVISNLTHSLRTLWSSLKMTALPPTSKPFFIFFRSKYFTTFCVFKSSSFSAFPHSRNFTVRWLSSTTFHLKWFLLRNELCWGYQQYIDALDRALKTKLEMNSEHWKWCFSDSDSVDYGADFVGGLRLFTLWGHWPPPMLKFFSGFWRRLRYFTSHVFFPTKEKLSCILRPKLQQYFVIQHHIKKFLITFFWYTSIPLVENLTCNQISHEFSHVLYLRSPSLKHVTLRVGIS